jgi:hypothetical protein
MDRGNGNFHALVDVKNYFIRHQIDSKTIILLIVLYGCETWFLTLREGVWEQGAEENIWT